MRRDKAVHDLEPCRELCLGLLDLQKGIKDQDGAGRYDGLLSPYTGLKSR